MGLSPMMIQYNQIKEQYPDCVVFYRLGDFYEMFFDDAIKVSKLLDLTLTGRDCGLPERAPMCGVPYHAVDTYIAKLVEMDLKVAICEQVTDPKASKGIVEREVVRIVSRGTITENSFIDEKTNNFLVSVYNDKDDFAVAWADITTGDFYAKKINGKNQLDALCDLLVRINAKEIICLQNFYSKANSLPIVEYKVIPKFSPFKEFAYNFTHAERVLKEHFNVLNLQCFGIENDKSIISACGALIEYLNETQKHSLINISKIVLEEDGKYMSIDSVALKNLEIVKTLRDGKRFGSLLWLIDNTTTPMGSRYLYDILTKPLQNKAKINYRLDGVEELYKNTLIRNAVRTLLETYRDTERLAGKISNNIIEPKDVVSLANSLSLIPQIKFSLLGSNSKILNDVINNLTDFTPLTDLIKLAIKENPPVDVKNGDFINDGFDKELDRLRKIKTNSKTLLTELETREKELTGIKTLKVGFNKVFGYYIEVSNSFKDKVPYSYVRKQTLVNGERFITEELKNLEEDILNSSEKAKQIEYDIFAKIKDVLKENITKIINSSKCVAVLDSLISLATVAKKYGFTRPIINDFGTAIDVKNGRHPVVEGLINEQFIPNDTLIDCEDNRMIIITGPNMAGKSTYMRQIAIITILAHIGSFVPCQKAEIPLVDKIFTRVGASDSLISEQSTFMVEMSEVANILNKATKNSLIILDEVGRGTSTYDGLSIAWAVVEYIASKIKAKTLFATHYHELSELEGRVDGVKNYKVTVKEFNGKIIFLRKIIEGSANKSFGIEVASLAGVPSEVTTYAKKVLKTLENSQFNGENSPVQTDDERYEISPIENALNQIDVDSMSPREALEFLYSLKKLIK